MNQILSMLEDVSGGTSSTRVWGSLIVATVCFVIIYCTVRQIQIPDIPGGVITLLGITFGLKVGQRIVEKPEPPTNPQ